MRVAEAVDVGNPFAPHARGRRLEQVDGLRDVEVVRAPRREAGIVRGAEDAGEPGLEVLRAAGISHQQLKDRAEADIAERFCYGGMVGAFETLL